MHGHHHEFANLWAATSPSAIGIVLVALMAITGVGLVLLLLRSQEPPEKPPPDAADRALRAIAKARGRLLEELQRAEGPLRTALSSMIEPPLRELDARVGALVATARASASPIAPMEP